MQSLEGYLAKEIDTKGMLRRTRRHLRYFRLIFSSGKLCIKEDQADAHMRSFLLQDLRQVCSLYVEGSEYEKKDTRRIGQNQAPAMTINDDLEVHD